MTTRTQGEIIAACQDLLGYDSDEIAEDVKTGNINEVLDDVVHERKSSEATSINNEGIDVQLDFLEGLDEKKLASYKSALLMCIDYIENGEQSNVDFFQCREAWRAALLND